MTTHRRHSDKLRLIVKTGSVSGTVEGKMTVESVQDEFTSEGRGYSAGISAGIGRGFDRNNPKGYGANLSSISAGHTRTDVEQRITRNVTEFTAGGGFLDVKGTVKQVGSLIDGNFTLNSGGYEHEDLKDIDKSRTAGINVTVYPNVSYSQRDKNGNQVYIDGSNPKRTGVAVKTGLTYGETDKTREILATVGAGVTMNQDLEGVNRDPSRQTTEFEGRKLKPVNVDLLTEYWATEAGRRKFRDIAGNSARSTQGIINVITRKSNSGEYNLIKNIISESIEQKMERIGFIDVKGKTVEQIQKEVESRFGGLTKKGIKVRFYGTGDMDLSSLTKEQLNRLMADGFATTGDGYIWINKDRLTNDTIDLNKLIQHELTHQILGDDTEYQARYVEGVYGDFLKGIKDSGYLTDGEIVDLMKSSMTDGDKARLNGYWLDDMQYRIFLDASSDITDEDREKIIKYLEELTGYDLELKKDISNKYKKECDEGNANKCGYEIDFVKDAKGNKKELSDSAKKYVKSNKLVDELIKTPKKVFITNEKDNNRTEKFGADRSGSHAYGNMVKLNTNDVVKTQVWDGNTVRKQLETIPKFVELAHELIHTYHWLGLGLEKNQASRYSVNIYKKHYVKMPYSIVESFSIDKNNKKLDGYDLEELITIGIGNSTEKNAEINGIREHGEYNIDSDITENDIRKEHKCIGINCITNNYSLDFRVSHGILIDFGISPEEEAKINRIRQEMEKKR